ncbi:unnamed protein product [Danaus chrysippus]|uniref:(African queen) hypothetical protein n=1 Tax=Danaus chrysippus TaxID=151541 RepID=A0A8J2Q094_9NEOP|nr:unnamed protein product [Danaus chrysippus]
MLYMWYIISLLNLVPLSLISAKFNDQQSKFRENLRIVGGRDALPGEFPYVLIIGLSVLLSNNSKIYDPYCTCACLKPTWTLTAAHCIEYEKLFNIPETAESVIRYHKTPNEVGYAKILSKVINPNYVASSNSWLRNDVGLLKTESIDIPTYGKLSAVDYTTLYGFQIFAVGYGLTEDIDGHMKVPIFINKTLQVVNAVIIKCNENIHPVICLTGVCGRWSALCPGDSGAPVIHSSGIIGVNSASNKNECVRRQNSKPENTLETAIGMITPISPFVNWINWLSWRLIRTQLYTLAVSAGFSSSWRTPREAFLYGGLSFSLAQTVAAVLVALPTVLLQLAVGQLSQQDAAGVWRAVPFFKGVGFLRLLISFVGSIYTVIYVGMCVVYLFYTVNNTFTDCMESMAMDDVLQVESDVYATACSNFYNPVKFMKRIFYVTGPLVYLLGVIIVSFIGTTEGLSSFTESDDWINFLRPYIWYSALTQALLSTQTAGGYLISSGDTLYSDSDVQYTSFVFVAFNIVSCWIGTLFWFAIGGSDAKVTSNAAVLVQIYKVTIERNLSNAWPILVYLLLFISGIITMVTFLYPLYDRFRRVGGYKWRYLSVGSSTVGVGAAMAVLAFGHSPLTLLEDIVMPLMISLATLVEISAFIFIYGWKVLVEDIEFLTGYNLRKYWVLGWFLVIGVLAPFTAWWTADWFIDTPNWTEPPWEATSIVITAGFFVVSFLIFAAISISKQVQYDFMGKLKSSFKPSRHWGPRDPITHYYWLARREGSRDVPHPVHRRPVLGEFSGASSLATIITPSEDCVHETKRRSNSDDQVVVNRKQYNAELNQIKSAFQKRPKSLDWNFSTKNNIKNNLFIKKSHDLERKTHPNEPIVIIKEMNNNTISLESLDI